MGELLKSAVARISHRCSSKSQLTEYRVMVNHGASKGCITCKERHVKCDETKPACKECVRLRRRCAGYGRGNIQVRFKDETSRYSKRPLDDTATTKTGIHEKLERTRRCAFKHQHLFASQNLVMIAGKPQCKQQDIAYTFFLKYVTQVGRSLESTRGFLEFVCPVLAAEAQDSALHAAVSATAIKLWALLRPSDVAASLPVHIHNQALIKLQRAIDNPEEQKKQATVFATLMLQYHATLSAVFDHHEAQSTHRHGALALLTQKGHNAESFQYRRHLLGNYFHSKISSCVRHKVPLAGSELDWIQTEVIPALPSNPSFLLDLIGMSVSKLQSALTASFSSPRDSRLDASQELWPMVCDVDAQLRTWSDAVPTSWRPRSLQKENVAVPSVATYNGAYDIYPSMQIANIWNTWRMYRLVVEHTKLALTYKPLAVSGGENPAFLADRMLSDTTSAWQSKAIQNLSDSVCRSIPFYLGNCYQPISFSDLDDSQVVFPSYHDLPLTDEAFIDYKRSDHYCPKVDHYRHVVLHGPFHALSILSSLIEFLSEHRCLTSTQDELCRQKQWISGQFHRSLYLTRFSPRTSKRTGEVHQPGYLDQVRQVIRTVTIL